MAKDSSDLVTFNVGGKIYQVLREPTLSLHPNSLLTQMAEEQKDDKPIFVEGKVHLPLSVSKEAVLHELKRFGLEATAEQIVEDAVAFSTVKKRMMDWAEENKTKKRKKCSAELIGTFVVQAAIPKSAEDQGKGFVVERDDIVKASGIDLQAFKKIFGGGAILMIVQSESLQAFARSFGYIPRFQVTGVAWSIRLNPAV